MKSLYTSILLLLLATATSAKEIVCYAWCNRFPDRKDASNRDLPYRIPRFIPDTGVYRKLDCAVVDCSRTCRRSLEACKVLCDGNEDLPFCAMPDTEAEGMPNAD
ncbi:hypothetical protein AA0113_g4473 [Alternaria arborescens]|uniref:Secreted protein n=1 Tax=Alternaria arborescens TaxID=156630 RepID=A0A4V1X6Q6_9PLEO|nr:hypothetical protein AA0113_g4473 [Alternaria arborescens]